MDPLGRDLLAPMGRDLSARQHGVRYVRTPDDALADVITRLANDKVATDDTEDLIVALKRAHVIDAATMISLLGNYLDEKFNVGSVMSQELAGLLAELPDGFEITDEMRSWMNMPEVGKEVWWRDGCGAGYLELAAKLRSYIPDGDGYNSDYAKTLGAAADALQTESKRIISEKKRRRKKK